MQWCFWRFQWLWWLTSTIHKIYDTCPEKMRTCLNKNFFFRQICISDSYKDDFVISKEWKAMRKVEESWHFYIFIWKHSSSHGISYMRYPSFIQCSNSCKLNFNVDSYPYMHICIPYVYESFSDVPESWVWLRADFQNLSVFSNFSAWNHIVCHRYR